MFGNRLERLMDRGGLVRAVMVLVGGTASAHAITAIALPILTRLYTPSDFNVLAIFSSLLSVVSVAACLRFDVAIPIPERKADALLLLILSILSVILVTATLGLSILLVQDGWFDGIGLGEVAAYLWLLPIGVLLTGLYSTFQNWFLRQTDFALIARSRVIQSAASSGTQIGMAGLIIGPIGLLTGYLLNSGAAGVLLGKKIFVQEKESINGQLICWKNLKAIWGDYSHFPKYSTWEALANSAAIQIPVILIAALVAGPEAGYLFLAMTVIQAPMSLFGTSISQVYLSRAPHEYRDGSLAPFTARIFGGLLKAGVGPLLAAGILSPFIFDSVFGEGWGRAGWLVAWMTPWFIAQFLATPMSMAVHVTGHHRYAFYLQLFGLIFRISLVVGASKWPSTPVSEVYAASGALFYFAYLLLILYCVGCGFRQILPQIYSGAKVILTWVLLALFLLLALKKILIL